MQMAGGEMARHHLAQRRRLLAAARVRVRLLAVETEHEVYALRSADRVVVARALPLETTAEAA